MSVFHVGDIYTLQSGNSYTHEEVCMKMTSCMIKEAQTHFLRTDFVRGSKEFFRMNSVCHVYGINKYALLHYSCRQKEQQTVSFLDYK